MKRYLLGWLWLVLLGPLAARGLEPAPQFSEQSSGAASDKGLPWKWKPAPAPLLTPWAKEVSPEKVWPEYPRPQMVRAEWQNLNGLWDYALLAAAPVPDASGQHHDGSAQGAPRLRPKEGPGGMGAWEFDGQQDAVSVPRLVQDDFTISFWLRTRQRGKTGPWYQGIGLVDGEVAGVTDDFGTTLVGDSVAFGVGNPDVTLQGKTPVNDDRWHHVAAVRQRQTGEIRLYLDGKEEARGQAGKQALTAPPRLLLGQLQTGGQAFRGLLADVRLYQQALSPAQIAALARTPGVRGEAPGLVGWWRLDQEPQKLRIQDISYQGKILVPFPVESALSGVRKPLLPGQVLCYRRTFRAPPLSKDRRLLLHFGAVDWHVEVYVNGRRVGEHTGGYDAFTLDITEALRPDGENELIVLVWDATDGIRGKQLLSAFFHPSGIFYTPCSGIWQTVWLEAVPARRIEDFWLRPDIDAGLLRLTVWTAGPGTDQPLEVVARAGGKEVARARGWPGKELVLPIPQARLWSPEDPFLYDLELTMGSDRVRSYFGMRKVSLGKDERGVTRILLNNRFVFQVGVLDQGYWPDGIYTAPSDAALRFEVSQMRQLGLNLARKHVKVEPQRWYYWCDKLGLLVWQDMPSGDLSRGGTAQKEGLPLSPQVAAQFRRELQALIQQHRNHPCILMWVVFNEGWGQHDTVALTQWVKELDPDRLVDSASGWFDRGCGDVRDLHQYPGPGSPKPEGGRAAVLGEFGGLGLALPGHVWSQKSWGYRGLPSSEALTREYVRLWQKAWQLKEEAGLSAAVYTQWTDVETECNGLWTYDRRVLKVDAAQAQAAHRGQFAPGAGAAAPTAPRPAPAATAAPASGRP
jgi:hypothetical protein